MELAVGTLAFVLAAVVAQPPSRQASARSHDGSRDFDFLHGDWTIRNRRLRDPLTGSTEWYEFAGRSVERPLWDGQANLEEYEATLPDGTRLRGLALRLHDPRADRWTIHWSTSARGTLDPPVRGTFHDGRGEFYGEEEYQGRTVPLRFLWTSDGPDAARWEQAYSADGGTTWETNWIMEFTRAPSRCCAVVELRRYRLHPGMRDTLIALFDREFVESQETAGMQVIAQFRDIDDPDVFTWLRGFADMPSRAAALGAFYGGPVWATHKNAANRTMISSDDVRLLRPAHAGSGFVPGADRAAPGATEIPPGLVVATIYTLAPGSVADFRDWFQQAVVPRLSAAGTQPFAMFETELAANTFPRLPVREGEHAFVWFAGFPDVSAYDRHTAALAADPRWTGEVRAALERHLAGPPEVWRLTPTARSRTLR